MSKEKITSETLSKLKEARKFLNEALVFLDKIRIPKHLTLLSMLWMAPTSYGEKLNYAKAAEMVAFARDTINTLCDKIIDESGHVPHIESVLLMDVLYTDFDIIINQLYKYKNAKTLGMRIKEIIANIDNVLSMIVKS